jgi:hypothetical protein
MLLYNCKIVVGISAISTCPLSEYIFVLSIANTPPLHQCHKLKGKSQGFPFFRFTFHFPSVKLRSAKPVNKRIPSKTGKIAVKLKTPRFFPLCS